MTAARRIPLALSIGALLVLALEGALRLAGFGGGGPEPFDFASWEGEARRPGMFETHPERFFALAPHYRHSEATPGRYATGDWPFRGRPPEPAPAGIARVAVLGDSCAYGLTLYPNETIPVRIEHHLFTRGILPTQVQVLNFGNPGYTTVQIRALLDDVLAEHAPDHVVLYPAAWNDQAPALGRNDLELRAAARSRSAATWVRSTAIGDLVGGAAPAHEAAPAPVGVPERPRVPAEAVGAELAAMLDACEAAGASVTVIVPPHPEGVGETHPRLIEDEETVRRMATEAGVHVVDGPRLFAAHPRRVRLMTDIAHPSPEGADLLAREVAAPLFADLAPAPEGALGGISIGGREGRQGQGGEEIVVRLEGWTEDDGTPAVTFAGGRLLDLVGEGDGRFRGVTQAGPPGSRHWVLAECRTRSWFDPGGDVVAPLLQLAPAPIGVTETPRLELLALPGSRATVYFARPGEEEYVRWTEFGAVRLDPARLLPFALELEGMGDPAPLDDLPAEPGETLRAQALVLPPGDGPDSLEAAYTLPVEVVVPPR